MQITLQFDEIFRRFKIFPKTSENAAEHFQAALKIHAAEHFQSALIHAAEPNNGLIRTILEHF